MSRVVIEHLTNLSNENSAVNSINDNFDNISTALDNSLARDGSLPNSMNANLDMNSYRIHNLPAAVDDDEPARYGDIGPYADAAAASATAADASSDAAAVSAAAALVSETNASASAAAAAVSEGQAAAYAALLENPDLGYITDTPATGDWDLGSII